eukprot:jgi/Tetstr1/464678/TSEL_009430.t1
MEGDQSAAEQGAAAMADEAMAADSTGAAAANTAANSSARVTQTPLGTQADDILIYNDEDDPLLGMNPKEPGLGCQGQGATASYYGEAAFSAVAADLLKPCGEDWLASQVLDGEGEGEANRIQCEAVESMLEQYGAEPADEEAGD